MNFPVLNDWQLYVNNEFHPNSKWTRLQCNTIVYKIKLHVDTQLCVFKPWNIRVNRKSITFT